jgi:hypothetical protein
LGTAFVGSSAPDPRGAQIAAPGTRRSTGLWHSGRPHCRVTKWKRRQLNRTTTEPGQPAREGPPGKLRQLRRKGMDTHRRKSVLYRGPNGYPAWDVPARQPADWAGERTRTRHHNRSALAGPAPGYLPRRNTHKGASTHITEHGGPPPPGIRLRYDRRALSGGPPNPMICKGLSTQRPASEVVRGPAGVVCGQFGACLGPSGPRAGPKPTLNDPDRTPNNLRHHQPGPAYGEHGGSGIWVLAFVRSSATLFRGPNAATPRATPLRQDSLRQVLGSQKRGRQGDRPHTKPIGREAHRGD